MRFILRTILLLIFALVSQFLSGCDSDIKQNDKIKDSEDQTYLIIKIGNHQYLKYANGYRFGICHYEDCDYCMKNKEDKIK